MIFSSDNWAGATDAVMAALARHTSGFAPAYGVDPLSRSIEAKFNEVFEREVAVFLVSTGTAANSLALANYAKPGGAVFCHEESHIVVDECGAPEFTTGGNKLFGIAGEHGKINAASLAKALTAIPEGVVHHGQASAVSITQATEIGTLYTPSEIAAINEVAKSRGLPLHMDGARFANALVSLDISPAEMTWKQGVDVLSFGATKNGCWCAEAVVFFNPQDGAGFEYLRKRSAQLFSKSRFISAQFEGYFEDDNWLQTARHANAMAARLAEGLKAADGVDLPVWPQANEVFPIISRAKAAELQKAGAGFYEWPAEGLPEDRQMIRLVTSFATTTGMVDEFISLL
ncbi:low specificity L-threonine aldolase [Pseudovibrio exalbescens]|uniref:threonine aldolase family protein n=1 Tax=Pseudovibrio exalbescens TaxID=197461 RepID=UPI002366B9C4|nr:low specificity L-threonine aldolase [Pseudovibrio exalbescens]MDD7911847.1 low specificity L-threonine aldolase [Pseudovibrio exalbescens]